MKYLVKMYRCESKEPIVFAETAESAVEMCRQEGWSIDFVTELHSDGEGETYEVSGRCENCSRVLLDEHYRTDSEGVMFCNPCWDKLTADL